MLNTVNFCYYASKQIGKEYSKIEIIELSLIEHGVKFRAFASYREYGHSKDSIIVTYTKTVRGVKVVCELGSYL